jgi:hypothetical protein
MGSEGKGKPHPHPHKGGLPAAVTDEDFYDDGLPLEAKVALGNFLLSDKKKGKASSRKRQTPIGPV